MNDTAPIDLVASYKVEIVALEELKPYGRNARTHSPDQVLQLAALIRGFLSTQPIAEKI